MSGPRDRDRHGRHLGHRRAPALLCQLGRPAEARAHIERVLSIREKVYGQEHPFLISALFEVGNVLLRLQKPREAGRHFERAFAICLKLPCDEENQAYARFGQAKHLGSQPGRRDESRALARKAAEGFAAIHQPELAAEVRDWLRAH